MKHRGIRTITTVLGLLLLAGGLYLAKTIGNPEGILRALPYICIGLGCGLFGHGMGGSIEKIIMKRYPDRQKQNEIERKDERNQEIAARAKAKAYDMMVFVYGALMMALALMNVDLIVTLLLVFSYLFIICWEIYYRIKLEKEL